jgi:hypothetical protein
MHGHAEETERLAGAIRAYGDRFRLDPVPLDRALPPAELERLTRPGADAQPPPLGGR